MTDENRIEKASVSMPQNLDQLLEEITPTVYDNLKTAVEIGRWDDGSKLSSEQLEHCMQAIILYEAEHVQEQDRTGALLAGCKSADSQ